MESQQVNFETSFVMLQHSVIPKRRTEEALSAKAAVYSVSLGLDETHVSLTIEGYKWVLGHFTNVIVCLGDNPLLETSLKIQGISTAVAKERGSQIAAKAISKLNEIKADSTFALASELIRDPLFQGKLDQVRQAYQMDDVLQAAVTRDADKYVQRLKRQSRLGLPSSDALELARDYILFEIAMYSHLAERGYSVDVYVGEELWTLRQFLYGRMNCLPELAKRMFISLKPEPNRV